MQCINKREYRNAYHLSRKLSRTYHYFSSCYSLNSIIGRNFTNLFSFCLWGFFLQVNVTLHRKTNRLEHQGIKIQFIGQIELYYDRGNHHEFLSLVKELARPGEILQNTSFDFEFNQVEKPYECYTGANVRLR